jgi:phosphatidylglycerophosphate synthase
MTSENQAESVLPLYAATAPEDRNIWQKMAFRTNGWVSPASAVSVAGMALTLDGLYDFAQGNRAVGIAKVAAGKFADFFDGKIARATGTASEQGEMVDAGSDTVTVVGALATAFVTEAVPLVPLAAITARNAYTMGATVYAKSRGLEIHATRASKINQFIQWPAIGSFLIASSVEAGAVQNSFEAAGLAGAAVSVPLGFYGTYQGMKLANELSQPSVPPLEETA